MLTRKQAWRHEQRRRSLSIESLTIDELESREKRKATSRETSHESFSTTTSCDKSDVLDIPYSPSSSPDKPAYKTSKKKSVRWCLDVHVVLIPTRAEYFEHHLDELVWWADCDYALFKLQAAEEIRDAMEYLNISLQEALKILYQPGHDYQLPRNRLGRFGSTKSNQTMNSASSSSAVENALSRVSSNNDDTSDTILIPCSECNQLHENISSLSIHICPACASSSSSSSSIPQRTPLVTPSSLSSINPPFVSLSLSRNDSASTNVTVQTTTESTPIAGVPNSMASLYSLPTFRDSSLIKLKSNKKTHSPLQEFTIVTQCDGVTKL